MRRRLLQTTIGPRLARGSERPSARFVALAACVLSLVSCSGCRDDALQAAVDAGDHATPNALTPEQAARVLAKVGDKTITLGDYVATLEQMDRFDRIRYQSPERRKELLEEMIDVELLAAEAVRQGYDKDPRAAQDERGILREAALREVVQAAPKPEAIPAPDVRRYYDSHRAEYRDPERRRLSLIQVGSEAKAKALLERARTADADTWGKLVGENSQDPSLDPRAPIDLRGDVGLVSPPGDSKGKNEKVPEPVRVAAFKVKKAGQTADEVVAHGGQFYLVRVIQISPPRSRSFEEAERVIRVKLAQDKLQELERATIRKLKTKIEIKIDEKAIAQVKVDTPKGKGKAQPEEKAPE